MGRLYLFFFLSLSTSMAFKERKSKDLSDAQKRDAGLSAIDSSGNLDLSNNLTQVAYRAQIDKTALALDAHNTALAEADKRGNVVKAEEKILRKLSSKILAAVALKYGLDSSEYEQVGGTRESERQLRGRRLPKPTPPAA